jgi:hypothetical protein
VQRTTVKVDGELWAEYGVESSGRRLQVEMAWIF